MNRRERLRRPPPRRGSRGADGRGGRGVEERAPGRRGGHRQVSESEIDFEVRHRGRHSERNDGRGEGGGQLGRESKESTAEGAGSKGKETVVVSGEKGSPLNAPLKGATKLESPRKGLVSGLKSEEAIPSSPSKLSFPKSAPKLGVPDGERTGLDAPKVGGGAFAKTRFSTVK